MSDTRFSADYSKRLSKCKKCKKEIAKSSIRMAKLVANYFHDGDGDMKNYYHVECLFETFGRARASTKIIESADDIQGFSELQDEDKDLIIQKIKELGGKTSTKVLKTKETPSKNKSSKLDSDEIPTDTEIDDNSSDAGTFEQFQNLCTKLANESGSLRKTEIIKTFIKNDVNKGYLYLLIKMLLPNSQNNVYNLNSLSIIKLFSKILNQNQDEMLKHLNKGDVADTIRTFFEKSSALKPQKSSKLNLKQIDVYLKKLTQVTKEQDQVNLLSEIARQCTSNDLLMFIRLIKKDLRINAGEKPVLDALAPQAYEAFKVSRDLEDVIRRATKSGLTKDLSIRIQLMKPIKPMLADACKSVEQAMKKCANGMYAEIKYDGERLQIHKRGKEFNYFSRNLKQVQAHKVEHLKEYIPKAFPSANELILDGEILLYDLKAKKPLPFGTLGVHKKNAFKEALVCYTVFDCIYLNGEDLMGKSVKERRKILEDNVKEIPGRIMLSEKWHITKMKPLQDLMMKAINEGLEGLVLKDVNSVYEPGKRHWLKMKKDYLNEGSMADTVDLVVLGAYYGTGRQGGMKSIFLMGVFNKKRDQWQTVTKCANGFDDETLAKLQKSIQMIEINKNLSKIPTWLDIHRSLVPDFIIKDPKKSPVWEITGAEFSKSEIHTANGISIRFPRVTRFRDDKTWKEATNLEGLNKLFDLSKQKSDVKTNLNDGDDDDEEPVVTKKPRMNKSNNTDKDDDDDDEIVTKKSNEQLRVDKNEKNMVTKATTEVTQKRETNPLPCLFTKVKFILLEKFENEDKLKRYIIAYDGELLDRDMIDDATHVIVSDDTSINTKGAQIQVKVKDIWNCIKLKKKL